MKFALRGDGVNEGGISYASAGAIETYMQEIDGKDVTNDDLVLLSALPEIDEKGNPVNYENSVIPNIEILGALSKDDAPLYVLNTKTKRVEPMMVVEDERQTYNGGTCKFLMAGEDLTRYLDQRLKLATQEDLKEVKKPKFVKEPGRVAKFFDKWFGITFSSITKHKKYLKDMKKYTKYVKTTAYTNMKNIVEENKATQKTQQEKLKKAQQEKLQKEQEELQKEQEQSKKEKDKNFVNSVSWQAYEDLSKGHLKDEQIVSAFATIMATHAILEPDKEVAEKIDAARNAGPQTGNPFMAEGEENRKAMRAGIAGNYKRIENLRNEVMESEGFKAFVTKDESGKLIPNDKMREHVQKMVAAHNKPGKPEADREAEQYLRECDCNKEMQARELAEEERKNDKNLHLNVQNVKGDDLKMQTP